MRCLLALIVSCPDCHANGVSRPSEVASSHHTTARPHRHVNMRSLNRPPREHAFIRPRQAHGMPIIMVAVLEPQARGTAHNIIR